MGEFSASDCSWKKMVIVRENDKWISCVKSGETSSKNTPETSEVNTSEESKCITNIKREIEDSNNFQNNRNTALEPDTMIQEIDPLLIEYPSKPQRRQSTGLKNETPEERAVRLAKMSAYAARRLANETPEQRSLRLKRMSAYAARRLAQETNEQRSKRLARMSAYAAQRLAKESPEQRKSRLARMSAYAAKRQALKKLANVSDGDSNSFISAYNQFTQNISDQS